MVLSAANVGAVVRVRSENGSYAYEARKYEGSVDTVYNELTMIGYCASVRATHTSARTRMTESPCACA